MAAARLLGYDSATVQNPRGYVPLLQGMARRALVERLLAALLLCLALLALGTAVGSSRDAPAIQNVPTEDQVSTLDLLAAYDTLPMRFEANQEQADKHVIFLSRGHGAAPFLSDRKLSYSTYLGGSAEGEGYGLAVDRAGNAYVAGATQSPDFPTTPHAWQRANAGSLDAFVAKLNARGQLVYSTYLGGRDIDVARGIAVDSAGNAYVVGGTRSPDFPTTPHAWQRANAGSLNAFVAKLNARGQLVYGTYLGGRNWDAGTGIAVDGAGNAYITGQTESADFPTTPHAPQRANGGDSDAFVAKLNPRGQLVYGTYLGGRRFDEGTGIAVDRPGDAYVTGWTHSADFPTTAHALQRTNAGNFNAFAAVLNASGQRLIYGTYLGGHRFDVGNGIAVDRAGNAYLVGSTLSPDFPTTVYAWQRTKGGTSGAFVARLGRAAGAAAQ